MWKRPEEITAHNQQQGRGEKFDPAQWIHTLVVEVETLWLEGDVVILAGCCESVRVRRDDVIAWRELPGGDGHASTYEVRLREGADAMAQRAVKVSRNQPRCPRCDRGWDGLPPARGRDENSPDRRDRDECRGESDHGHRHGHHEHHGSPGGHAHREHGGGGHHYWHHAHGMDHHHHGEGGEPHHHDE